MTYVSKKPLPDLVSIEEAIKISRRSRTLFYNLRRFDPKFPTAISYQLKSSYQLCFSKKEICEYFEVEE